MKMKEWNVVKKSMAYECPFFSISEDELLLSDGSRQTYYIMNRSDFVSVVAHEDGYIYLVEMNRYTLGKEALEIPMGGMEDDELPVLAAQRELREETGIIAEEMRQIGVCDAFKGQSKQKFYVFIAEKLSFVERELDLIEKESGLEVRKMKISEVADLIRSGKISDASTIASFQLFMLNCNS
jgi:8-oxo-dGTP pyrophosphatase MutT (NUDIX family)